ncbi:hypothetical protein F4V43_05555 [Paenibacillus spiritus]|uniref:DUF2802 domain-containing protein n=1 Tax=Paenibacillus spiritus TaxID=2496557 RepID=A0A5J5GDZ2_9BACL|nr:hypothetical protein [Paenibacillus spiritus]KAA9006419.1 hypothetical protein F4V43_05555 [Paenibacillus spiritus]
MQPWGYIVLLGFVAIAFGLTLPARAKTKPADSDRQALKEVEAALELYMADIERENGELVNLLGTIKAQSQSGQAALQEQVAELKGQLEELRRTSAQVEARVAANENGLLQVALSGAAGSVRQEQTISEDKIGADRIQEENTRTASTIKPRYPQLFELHEQGKSIDYIAKKTGMQKGEVQLILQLAKQEEESV